MFETSTESFLINLGSKVLHHWKAKFIRLLRIAVLKRHEMPKRNRPKRIKRPLNTAKPDRNERHMKLKVGFGRIVVAIATENAKSRSP
jgi:hypothetical protein